MDIANSFGDVFLQLLLGLFHQLARLGFITFFLLLIFLRVP